MADSLPDVANEAADSRIILTKQRGRKSGNGGGGEKRKESGGVRNIKDCAASSLVRAQKKTHSVPATQRNFSRNSWVI